MGRYLWDDRMVSREWVLSEIEASAGSFADRGFGQWAVQLLGSGELIGFWGYRFFHHPSQLQLLYGLAEEHWNQGLATEAARAMIRYGFEELGFDRIIAATDAPNLASARVMEKAGMKFDKRLVIEGLDTVYYALSREDYLSDEAPFVLR